MNRDLNFEIKIVNFLRENNEKNLNRVLIDKKLIQVKIVLHLVSNYGNHIMKILVGVLVNTTLDKVQVVDFIIRKNEVYIGNDSKVVILWYLGEMKEAENDFDIVVLGDLVGKNLENILVNVDLKGLVHSTFLFQTFLI